jgi:tetratricopeptide (TPR) repeat protein
MPPEQARGESEHIDERSDVFGLGGILCEVLTGQPPYAGPGYRAALSKAARADLADAFARLDDCGADPELVSLAKRCLSPERDDRPADAAAVAAAVAAYRAGVRERLRRAELERTAAEARAAGERHRRHLTLALAASLVLTVALAGGGWAWLERDRSARATAAAREEFEARRAVEAALDEAEARQRLADWPAARTALARAAGRLGAGGPDDLRDRLQTAERDLDLVAALDEVRAGKAAFADRFTMNAADAGYARVFRAHGLDVAAGDPAAVADRIRGSAARLALVAALDDWSLSTADSGGMRARVLTVARLADPGPWADRFRDPAVWTDRAALQRLAADAPADLSPTLLANLAVLLRTAGGDGLAVLRQAQARRPDDFWVNLVLAIELSNTSPGTPGLLGEEAVGFYRAAVALRPYSPVAYYLLGYQLHKQGRNDQAAAPFREAARLQPGFLKALILLGHVRSECGDLAGTAEALREAVRFNPDSAEAHYGLGAALLSLRHWPESVAESREAARLRPELPEVQFILGLGLQSLGQLDEAATAYRAAAAAYRATAPAELRHALAHHNLGTVLAAQGRLAEAAAEFREAIRLNPGIVPPHNDLAGVFLRQGRFAAALAELRRADELHPEGRRWPAPIARAARLAEFAADVGGWVTAPFGL